MAIHPEDKQDDIEKDKAAEDFAALGLPVDACYRVVHAYLQATSGPTPIQVAGIPAVLNGYNVALLGETGSGKTLAYALPLLERLRQRDIGMIPSVRSPARPRRGAPNLETFASAANPRIVVLAPTAELCAQVLTVMVVLAECCAGESESESLYTVRLMSGKGGKKTKKPSKRSKASPDRSSSPTQTAELRAVMRAEIIVATPGRLLSEFRAGALHFGRLEAIVLDEADEFVSMGFKSVLNTIMRFATTRALGPNVPRRSVTDVQVVFVAATLSRLDWDEGIKAVYPGNIKRVVTPLLHLVSPRTQQSLVTVRDSEERVSAVVDAVRDKNVQTLIFGESPEACDLLAHALGQRLADDPEWGNNAVRSFHGRTDRRTEVLDDFWAGDHRILVCTDLGARGLDFPNVRHVIQYTLPPTPEMYLHRMGRTARAGQKPPFFATVLINENEDDETMMAVARHGAEEDEKPRSLVDTKRRSSSVE